MGYESSKFVRFQDDANNGLAEIDLNDNTNDTWLPEPGTNNYEEEVPWKAAKSLKGKVLSRVFFEDYEKAEKKILDPRGLIIRRWNKIFLVAFLVSLSLDPLFFYLPVVHDEVCIAIAVPLEVILTLIRTLANVFYMIQIYIRFHTAYVAPSSRVFGRGELVIDSSKIAIRYLSKGFFIDLIAALPLPQVLIWIIIPTLKGSTTRNTKNVLRFFIIFQYLPRLSLIFPLSSQIIKSTTSLGWFSCILSRRNLLMQLVLWAGAAYNLMLYLLASHLSGAWWYLLVIERQEACWRSACDLEQPNCQNGYFDCHNINDDSRTNWVNSTNVTNLCVPTPTGIPVFYHYGIYGDAVNTNDVIASRFFSKYFYCLWWGLRNLSSTGQNLSTSTYMGEDVFTIFVATLGLFLFALLIGNMQQKEMDEHEFSVSGRPLKASFWTNYAELLIEETRSRRFVLNSVGSVPSDNFNSPQKPVEVDFD
ncbi:protein CNGC15b-like [Fagus crenata]